MSPEPESLILQLLREMRADMDDIRSQMATKADLRSEIHSLRADVASDFLVARQELLALRKEFGEQIVGLRRAVMEYHTLVIGHGILISEIEARLRRVEQHLNLPAPDAH